MKILLCSLVCLFVLGDEENYLELEIQGLSSAKGNLMVAIYTQKNEFPSKNDTFRNVIQTAKNKSVKIKGLPENDYAVAVYHDENRNGVLDKNLFGVPTEIYGFSNNVRGTFSSPSFEEAKFTLKSDRKLQIKLK